MVGSAAYPFPGTSDYSSYLLQAQSSGAKVVGLCNTGGDMENCVKQAREFGLPQRGMIVAALLGFITEVKSMGLEVAQGLQMSETFYWNLNDRTRAFTDRFLPKTPTNYPSSLHAACYAAVTHYLKAVADIGPAKARSGLAAIAAMKRLPTDDDCFGKNTIREDGRFLCPVYLFRVKRPVREPQPVGRVRSRGDDAGSTRVPADGGWRLSAGAYVNANVPDSRGLNLLEADPALLPLAALYLPPALLAHLTPHLHRLGALAGGSLDLLAGEADRNPPVLHHRTRGGEDRQHIAKHPAYREMERFGVWGVRPGGAVASRRRAGLAGADAAGSEIPAELPVRAGGVRADVPGEHDRQPHPHPAPLR